MKKEKRQGYVQVVYLLRQGCVWSEDGFQNFDIYACPCNSSTSPTQCGFRCVKPATDFLVCFAPTQLTPETHYTVKSDAVTEVGISYVFLKKKKITR
jgi:hypothetical protein